MMASEQMADRNHTSRLKSYHCKGADETLARMSRIVRWKHRLEAKRVLIHAIRAALIYTNQRLQSVYLSAKCLLANVFVRSSLTWGGLGEIKKFMITVDPTMFSKKNNAVLNRMLNSCLFLPNIE